LIEFAFIVKHGEKMDKKTLAVLNKTIGSKCACYVLISCSIPDNEGKMEVALNYEGEENLASYLLDSAQQMFVSKEHDESIEA